MEELTNWWNGLGQDVRWAIRDGLIVLAGLCAGLIVGRSVRGALVRKGLDRFLRAPWTSPEDAEQQLHLRPRPPLLLSLTGWLFTLTVWAGVVCVIGWLRRIDPAIDFAQVAVTRGWQVAVVILTAVFASGWLAHTIYALFQTPWLKRELDALFTQPGKSEGSFSGTAARAICIFIYAAFLLLVPVAIAGLFNLASFTPLVAPAWHLCARLLTVPAAFAVGYLGLAIMVGTTVFALPSLV